MNERTAAARLTLSVRTLQKMRIQGRGPYFLKLGRVIRYQQSDLEGWIASSRRGSTFDQGPEKCCSCGHPAPVHEQFECYGFDVEGEEIKRCTCVSWTPF